MQNKNTSAAPLIIFSIYLSMREAILAVFVFQLIATSEDSAKSYVFSK